MTGFNKLGAECARVLLEAMPQNQSQPMLWWRLITEAEEFRYSTGWGLAGLWGLIHDSDYGRARAMLDELLADEAKLTMEAVEIYERPRWKE